MDPTLMAMVIIAIAMMVTNLTVRKLNVLRKA